MSIFWCPDCGLLLGGFGIVNLGGPCSSVSDEDRSWKDCRWIKLRCVVIDLATAVTGKELGYR